MSTKIKFVSFVVASTCCTCPNCGSSNTWGYASCTCRDCGHSWIVDAF